MNCKKTASDSIERSIEILKKGGVIILPTDTVYGFSGIVDSEATTNFKTDAKIRAIKGRAETKPLIQLIATPEQIFSYTDDEIPATLLSKWPGALTIIVHVNKNYPYGPEGTTVAFRCPGDQWIRKIIAGCGAPIFSTSVNRSGEPVLDEEQAILKEFEQEVDLVVTDGDKKNALPSTLVSIENGNIKVLRQGTVII